MLVHRGRDQQSPVLVHLNLVADPPSGRSYTPHHKYGPPRPPIRMASYDSSTTDHDDEWSSDKEDPIIERLEMEEISNNNDPVFQSLETSKRDCAFVSTEHRHSPGCDAVQALLQEAAIMTRRMTNKVNFLVTDGYRTGINRLAEACDNVSCYHVGGYTRRQRQLTFEK